MHVGFSLQFQNLGGKTSDRQVMQHQLALADQVEPLGFDSVWAPEHHFTNYVMVPSITQLLTWIGARTHTIQLGSMVTVLPWNDPIRVAEQWSWLDHATDGRSLLGLGRGLGRVEFDNFGLNMGESRTRFVEYAEALLNALETGVIEHKGSLYRQRPATVRPLPAYSFRGRVYASAVSPESAKIMARLGVGLLIIAQKPWETTLAELEAYRGIYRDTNGEEAPKPLLVTYVVVNKSAARAQEMFEDYIVGYSRSAADHYEFANVRLAEIPGYEYYGALAKNIEKHGIDKFSRFLADLQVSGTPTQVAERLIDNQERADLAGVIVALSMGGMDPGVAQANLDLFAAEVLPRLKEHKVDGTVGTGSIPTAVAEALSTVGVSEHILPSAPSAARVYPDLVSTAEPFPIEPPEYLIGG